MQRTTVLMLVHHESDEPIDTKGETVEETLRHVPIPKRPTVHRPIGLAPFVELAKWIARAS